MKYRDAVRWMKRGSRARRNRMAWRRRTGPGYLFWAPAPADPAERQDALNGWVSLGCTEEGHSISWPPVGKTPAGHFWVRDEVAPYRAPYVGGGVIDGLGDDWYRHRKQ